MCGKMNRIHSAPNGYVCMLMFVLFIGQLIHAQTPEQWNSSRLYHELMKFNTLGSVLYVGAHPDDENTRLIAYFANEQMAKTSYLSLTRGGGGQNLIGPELKSALGIIRTHELLKARAVDGGQQLFTRAKDFGYCKHPEEAFKEWGEDEILRDVVRAFRRYQPDLVVNRFDHRTPGSTHGHHTGSAMLSVAAFEKANDPNYDPESATLYETWQPKRLMFNTSWWFYGGQEAFDRADKTNLLTLSVGHYYPHLGQSNGEIAALSRSMHKSQGFGSLSSREQQNEYLELILGDMPGDRNDPFEGVDRTWSRLGLDSDDPMIRQINEILDHFDFKHPSKHATDLLDVLIQLKGLPAGPIVEEKINHLTEIIAQCLGLYVTPVASLPYATASDLVSAKIEISNRSKDTILLHKTSSDELYFFDNTQAISLPPGQTIMVESLEAALGQRGLSNPYYWLEHPTESSRYEVPKAELIGRPFGPEPVNVKTVFSLNGRTFILTKPLVYKKRDRVNGEVFDPFGLLPELTVKTSESVLIFNDKKSKKINVTVSAHTDQLNGTLSLQHPDSWTIKPDFIDFELARAGQELVFEFDIVPPKTGQSGIITPIVQIGDRFFTKQSIEIDYPHIPKIRALETAKTTVVKMNVSGKKLKVGYVQGAGDKVDQGLTQLGHRVVQIDPKTMKAKDLDNLDALVLGIRTYNTQQSLVSKSAMINKYIAQGGLLLIQYQTTSGLLTPIMGPVSFKIGRDRVTDEQAKVHFLDPKHPILNTPNRLEPTDFDGWVQERGLYFAQSWDDEFTPLLGMNDQGEAQTQGALILAHFGKGTVIYTGLSLFRQIPEGVSGAYKLLANLLSYDHD